MIGSPLGTLSSKVLQGLATKFSTTASPNLCVGELLKQACVEQGACSRLIGCMS